MRFTIPILICCLYALSAVEATFSKKGNAEVQQGNDKAAEPQNFWSDDKSDDKDDKWSKDDKDGKHGHHDHEGDSDKDCASRPVSILIGTSTYAIPCLPNGSIVDLNGLIAPPASSSSSAAASSSASPGASVCDGTVDSCGDTTCVSCPNPENGQAICISNTCGITCNIGYTDCSGTCRNTQIDPNYCGTCGNSCPNPENGQAICISNTCGFTCNEGYTDCNGTCINTQTDPNNCGTCGNSCEIAQCSNGICGPFSGCQQLTGNNEDAFKGGFCVDVPPMDPFTRPNCRAACGGTPYYSLTYQAQADLTYIACCLCYDYSYHFYPLQPTDPDCSIFASDYYGQFSGVPYDFEGPGSEYVYIY